MAEKQLIKQIAEETREEGVKTTLADLHQQYGIDQRELGKIILIASLTMFIVSAPSALTLEEAHGDINQVNQDFSEVQGVMESESFQQSLETLEQRVGGQLGSTVSRMVDGLDTSTESVENLEETEQDLEETAELYKWLSLLGLIGVVTGLVTMFI